MNETKLSPLGFGCAPIMGKISKKQAIKAMDLAYDLGVTHFDVARSYGFGRAEKVVGHFIKDKRDKVTVTTKFGVVPPVLNLRTKVIIPIARTISKIYPQIKSRLKNKSGQLLAERNFDVNYARQCLDLSLSELNTDYIDIYLLHEPDKSMLIYPDELITFLEKSVSAGKMRQWGIALGSNDDIEWTDKVLGNVIQFEGNISTLPLSEHLFNEVRQKIVTRPFEGGLTLSTLNSTLVKLDLLGHAQELNVSLSDIALCLSKYIAGKEGTVLCSMFTPEHIRNNVLTINRFTGNEIMIYILDKIVLACNYKSKLPLPNQNHLNYS
ncbi:MAG: aldo/keto reductase [Methylococcales bacterium]